MHILGIQYIKYSVLFFSGKYILGSMYAHIKIPLSSCMQRNTFGVIISDTSVTLELAGRKQD